MDASTDSLLVAIADDRALIRVVGRGSFKSSSALKKFGVLAIEKGCREVRMDLESCAGMDSTFMGVVAGLAVRLRREKNGDLVMFNMNPKNLNLIRTLGLDRLVRSFEAAAPAGQSEAPSVPARELSKLEAEPADKRMTAETMLEAHEELIRLLPENLPKFKDVIAYLKEDLKIPEPPDERNR